MSDAAADAAFARLVAALEADPARHDFFATLRRVESIFADRPRWSEAKRPSQEALRLGQDAELDFAPAAIGTFDVRPRSRAERVARPRLGVRFFGLLGPQGPLPLHLTEHVRERARFHADPTTARFLDVFHHRLLSLFYRAWAQAQAATHLDRPGRDRYAAWLGAAYGREPAAGTALPEHAELHYAGLLADRSRHPEGLTKILGSWFDARFHIEEHVPQRLAIDPADRTRLGRVGERGSGHASRLGENATCGDRVLDRQFRFRVRIGPLSFARYESFIPGGPAWPALVAWIRRYAGVDPAWDASLVLRADDVPAARLGRHVRLGLTTWIGRAATHDRSDLRLRPARMRIVDAVPAHG